MNNGDEKLLNFLILLKICMFAHLSLSIFVYPTPRSKNFSYIKNLLKTLSTSVVTNTVSEVWAYVNFEKKKLHTSSTNFYTNFVSVMRTLFWTS